MAHPDLRQYLLETAGREIDYVTHDCLRWALGFHGIDHGFLPYRSAREAVSWLRSSGGWDGAIAEVAAQIGAREEGEDVAGAIILARLPAPGRKRKNLIVGLSGGDGFSTFIAPGGAFLQWRADVERRFQCQQR